MRIQRTKAEMERIRKRISARRSRRAAHKRKRAAKNPRSTIISPLTADLMGQMVILRVLENIGIRGRDIIELLAKAIVNPPPPTADQREPGTASTGKARASSKKKENRK